MTEIFSYSESKQQNFPTVIELIKKPYRQHFNSHDLDDCESTQAFHGNNLYFNNNQTKKNVLSSHINIPTAPFPAYEFNVSFLTTSITSL